MDTFHAVTIKIKFQPFTYDVIGEGFKLTVKFMRRSETQPAALYQHYYHNNNVGIVAQFLCKCDSQV